MTHVQTHSQVRSRPNRLMSVDYDPKIIDSQKMLSTYVYRGYDARLIGR